MSKQVESGGADLDPLVTTLLDTVDEPAAVCSLAGRVRAWNDAFTEYIDPPADRADLSFGDLVDCPSDPLARAVETGEETIGSGPVAGTDGDVTVAVRPVEREGEVTAVVATLSDPVDPFETDQALYEASVDAAADSVYVVDRSYTVRAASEGFTRFTGIPTEEVEGRDVDCLRSFGVVDADTFQAGIRSLRRLFAGESESERITAEAQLGDETGIVENRMSPITRNGEVVGVVHVVRDVTERERRREALAANRERLAAILEDLPVLLVAVDEDGRVDHCQGMDFEAFECNRDDFVGAPVETFESTCPRVVEGFERALAGEPATETETINDRTYKVCFEPITAEVDGPDGAVSTPDEGAIAVAIDITDRVRREEALQTREEELRAVIESSADPIAMQDVDGRYQVVNEAMLANLEADREAVIGARPDDIFPPDSAKRLAAHRRAVLETEAARVVEERFGSGDDEAVVQLTLAPYHGSDGEVKGTVTIARDITALERQREELETLTEIQELVQESMRALTGATTSDEIKRTVCDRLVDSEFYEFAWIGRRESGERELAPECSAGVADDSLDEITVSVGAEHGSGPGAAAYRTGEVQVVHDVTADPDFDPCPVAVEYGFESIAVVPLTHGSTTHGLLSVYADRPNAFSQRELAGFETLGEVVGFALSAAQYRRLAEADSVLELEFEVRGETPLMAATREHDCRFELDNAVRTSDDRVVNYLTVEGAEPDAVEPAIEAIPSLETYRRLPGEDGPDYELTLSDSVFQYLAEAGARGERGVVEDGTGHMYVEAPADVDVRQVTEAMRERFSSVDLAAKREQRQTDPPWWHSHGDIGATLTDRQRAVLKTAYYNGYYEWPRETDSEALADSLDIASTTFLQHLRKGHRRVLEAMFDS